MENNNDTKLLVGLLIGGLVGAGALYYIHAGRTQKTPVLKKIGKTISDVGQMIENCDLNSATDTIENLGSKLSGGADIVSNVSAWLDSGLKLWKQFKKD